MAPSQPCPCAKSGLPVGARCAVNELTGAPQLNPATVPADIGAVRIAPVGHYALTFTWSDGHATGIYPWEDLRALADGFGATQGGGA